MWLDLLIAGLLLGGIYALFAIGLSLIFGVSNILNIAHGEFVVLGGIVSALLFSFLGINPFIAIPIILVLFFGAGYGFQKALVRPITRRPPHLWMGIAIIVTLGFSLAISDLSMYISHTYVGTPYYSITYSLPIKLPVSPLRLLALITVAIAAAVLYLFIQRTNTGRIIRAFSQNKEAAIALGADVERTSAITFGIGTAIASLAGFFLVIIFAIAPFDGLPLTMKALTIVILGGLGSFHGALIGALILGVAEVFIGATAGVIWSPVVAVALLIIVLIIRPTGLFGK